MKAGSIGSAIIIASISVVLVGGLMIYAGLFANASLIQTFDSTLNPTAASGVLTFTGNTSNGELVNITNSGVTYTFEFNSSSLTPTVCKTPTLTVCIIVNVNTTNTSVISSGNLTNAINNNASVAAFVTAVNTTNKTTLSYITTGVAGNSAVTLAENVTNAGWGASTLTGGVDGMSAYGSTKTNVNSAFVILGIVLIFAGIGGLIATVFGMVGKTGVRQ